LLKSWRRRLNVGKGQRREKKKKSKSLKKKTGEGQQLPRISGKKAADSKKKEINKRKGKKLECRSHPILEINLSYRSAR